MTFFKRIGTDDQKKRRKLLVFISTNGTCRAPMASGYFKKILAENNITNIDVRDAGVMTVSGLLAQPEAIQVLDTVDVDLRRHASRKLSNETIKRADLILGMSSFHVQTALRQTDLAKGKTSLLKEFVGSDQKNVQISDPMGGTLEVYKKCFQEIKESCDKLVKHEFIVGEKAEKKEAKKPSKSKASRKAAEKPAEKAAEKPKAAKSETKKSDTAKKAKSSGEKKSSAKKSSSSKASKAAKPSKSSKPAKSARKSPASKPKKSDAKTPAKAKKSTKSAAKSSSKSKKKSSKK